MSVALAVFGAQSKSPAPDYLDSIRSFILEHEILQCILQEIITLQEVWGYLQNADSRVSSLANGPKYTKCLIDWIVHGQSKDVASIFSGIVSLPRLAIIQLAQYFSFLAENGISHSDFVARTASLGGIQGFCGGLPAAVAIASAVDEDELKSAIGTAIRIAYAIGVYAEFGDDSELPGVTTMVVRLKEEGQAEELIAGLPGVYVSAMTDPKSVSIVGPVEQLAALDERARERRMLSQAMDIRGKTHNPENAALGLELVELCQKTPLLDLGDAGRLKSVVRSNKTGVRPLVGSLTEELVTTILCDRCEWYELLTAAAADIKAAGAASISIACFGIGDCTSLMPFHKQGLTVSKQQWTTITKPKVTLPDPAPMKYPDDAVAIVGASCRLPGANNLDEYWQLISEGRDMHQELPSDRFDLRHSYRASLSGDFVQKRKFFGNFVSRIDQFDHGFFSINAREAVNMDPQQRMLLELAYETMESSGYMRNHERARGDNVGCFIGASFVEYLDNTNAHPPTAYTSTGTIRAFLCGRLSWFFGWTGPAEVIDTACSSSLVAVNRAVRAIRNGECSSALVGGVNLITGISNFMDLGKAGFLSPTGQCKPFDAAGDGYCRSEGGALIFLKPLSKAQEAGDNILGVIPGAGTNQGGLSCSLTIPDSDALSRLYQSVLEQGKMSPHDISYVEAHGTGTQAGDPVEMDSIRKVFGNDRPTELHVGSVKGNIGHAETAAGIAGLVKVLCMISKQSIPPQASHREWNPRIPLPANQRIGLSTRLQSWQPNSLRAGLVNSYGAAGSNAAVLCCEAPVDSRHDTSASLLSSTASYPIIVSAKTEASLKAYKASLANYLRRASVKPHISKVAYVLSHCRPRYRHSVVMENVRDIDDLVHSLETQPDTIRPSNPASTVLLFAGQSKQFVGITKELYDRHARFRRELDLCNTILLDLGYPSIIPAVFQMDDLEDIVVLQSGLVAVQYSMARCWMDAATNVTAVVGHSLGELTSLAVSGILSLKDCLKLVAARAAMVKTLCLRTGSMLAVSGSREVAEQSLVDTQLPLDIACYNAKGAQVIAGDTAAIAKLEQHLQNQAPTPIKTRRVATSHAFHSKLLDPIVQPLNDLASTLEWREASLPVYFCNPDRHAADKNYPSAHARNPVHFQETLEKMQTELGRCDWIEIGVDSPFIAMARQVLDPKLGHSFHTMSASSRPGVTTSDMLAQTVCSLWRAGVDVSYWQFLSIIAAQGSVWLPPYHFENKSMWLDNVDHAAALQLKLGSINQKVENKEDTPSQKRQLVFPCTPDLSAGQFYISPGSQRFRGIVSGHAVRSRPLCPASVYMESVAMAVGLTNRTSTPCLEFSHLEMQAPLGLASSDMQIQLTRKGDKAWQFSVTSSSSSTAKKRTLHAQGSVRVAAHTLASLAVPARLVQRRIRELEQSTHGEKLLSKRAYGLFSRVVTYSAFLKGILSIALYDSEAIATIRTPPGQPAQDESNAISTCEAVAMDNFIQVVGLLINTSDLVGPDEVMVCTAVEFSGTTDACVFTQDTVWKVHASFTQTTSSQASGDVFVFMPDGTLAAAFTGCQFTKVDITRLERALDTAGKQPSSVPPSKSAALPESKLQSSRPQLSEAMETSEEVAAPSSESTSSASSAQSSVGDDPLLVILEHYTGAAPSSVSDSMTFSDVGLDSLAAVEFASEVASTWQVEVDPTDILTVEIGALRKKLPLSPATTALTSPESLSDNESSGTVEQEAENPSHGAVNVEAVVIQLIAEITGAAPDALKPSMTLSDVGIDSLAFIEFGAGLPNQGAEAVDSGEISLESTIEEVCRKSGHSPMSKQKKYRQEAQITHAITPKSSPETSSHPKTSSRGSIQEHSALSLDFSNALLKTEAALPDVAAQSGFLNYWSEVAPKQTELVLAYITEAYTKLGVDLVNLPQGAPVPALPHPTRYSRLVERLHDILVAQGVIEMENGQPIVSTRASAVKKPSAQILEELIQQHPAYAIEARLISLTGPHLAECISGSMDATRLLFGTADAARVLEEYYARSPVLATATAQLVNLIGSVVDPTSNQFSRNIRILEVGAGTGGTTGPLLAELTRRNARFEYTFTDISPSLVAKAKRKFAKYDDRVRFTKLDLESSSSFAELGGPFDIVLGTNCVHATKDRTAVCARIAQLLTPTGLMVLSEVTRIIDWYDLVFGLLDGWWLSPLYPLQPAENWMESFARAGFQSTTFSVGSSTDLNTQQLLMGTKTKVTGFSRPRNTRSKGAPSLKKQSMVYKTVHEVDIEADVFLPDVAPTKPMPVAVLLHGGGHMTLSRQAVRPWQISLLLSHGILPVSFDYRLAPEVNIIEGAMEDVCDAVTWTRDVLPKALADKQIHVRPEKVVVIGWSSGGHLAMSTAWTLSAAGLSPPSAILSFYAPVDFLGDNLFPSNKVPMVGKLSKAQLLQCNLLERPLTNYTVSGGEEPDLGWVKSGDPRSECLLSLFRGGRESLDFGLSLMLSGRPGEHRTIGDLVSQPPNKERRSMACPTAHLKAGTYKVPTYIIHGDADNIAPFPPALAFHEEMVRQGLKSGFTAVVGGQHIHDLRSAPGTTKWASEVEPGYAFLFEILGC